MVVDDFSHIEDIKESFYKENIHKLNFSPTNRDNATFAMKS